MENIPMKLDMRQINSVINDKQINDGNLGFSCLKKNRFLSKSQRNEDFSKKFFLHRKDFLKNKRKNKKKILNEIPNTPHNTGQYLCHIYQENEMKENKNQKNNINDDFGINFFDEEDDFADDFLENLDFKLNEGSRRERLMSMEGKDLEDFLYKHEDIKEEKKLFKSAIILNKPENHINIEPLDDKFSLMKDK